MAALTNQRVLSVRHWNDTLFSFTTTRDPELEFENGQFVMVGLKTDEGKRILRAYSIVSPNHHPDLEFFSIKVADGPLTSRLQHIQAGDELIVSNKPTGTLLISDLHAGRNLYLLSTGTGLAPFLSIVRDPATFERFENVVLVHGVRQVNDLAYSEMLETEIARDPHVGEAAASRFHYYPIVSRESFRNEGRLTRAIDSGQLLSDLGLPPLDPAEDRAMICGSQALNDDTSALLETRGFTPSPQIGEPGDFVVERAFVSKKQK